MNELTQQDNDASLVISQIFNNITTREGLLDLAEFVGNMPSNLGEDPFPLFHSFADGMYKREIHIPKDHIVVGKIHRNEYFVNVLKGHLWCVSEFGVKNLIAPCSFKAPKGVKHIVYTLEDTVWSDTSKTDKTNVKEAEKELFAESYEELEYKNVIEELDINESTVQRMLTTDDLIDQPENWIEIKESDIQGVGVFTTQDIKSGEHIATARVKDNRTPAGRYANHSDCPNAVCKLNEQYMVFSAIEDIKENSEITLDYRNVRDTAMKLDGDV